MLAVIMKETLKCAAAAYEMFLLLWTSFYNLGEIDAFAS